MQKGTIWAFIGPMLAVVLVRVCTHTFSLCFSHMLLNYKPSLGKHCDSGDDRGEHRKREKEGWNSDRESKPHFSQVGQLLQCSGYMQNRLTCMLAFHNTKDHPDECCGSIATAWCDLDCGNICCQ